MRSLKLLVFMLAAAAFFTACSGSTETAKNTTVTSSTSAVPNSNSATPVVAGPNRVANANSNAESPLKSTDMRSRSNQTGAQANVSGTPVPPQFHPAAENSEWAVTMNRDGSVRETRVFKSNPQLARAEVFSKDGRNKVVKIFLRSGKTVNVNTDRPFNLQTVTVSEILAIAGIQSADPPSK